MNGQPHAGHPRDRSGRHLSRPDRQVQPSLLVRLDAAPARRALDVLLPPLGARTVEPATRTNPVVEEPWTAPVCPDVSTALYSSLLIVCRLRDIFS